VEGHRTATAVTRTRECADYECADYHFYQRVNYTPPLRPRHYPYSLRLIGSHVFKPRNNASIGTFAAVHYSSLRNVSK